MSLKTYQISYKESKLQALAEENPIVSDFLLDFETEGCSESDGENSVWTVELNEDDFSKVAGILKNVAEIKEL